jgi:hypothetical protein
LIPANSADRVAGRAVEKPLFNKTGRLIPEKRLWVAQRRIRT